MLPPCDHRGHFEGADRNVKRVEGADDLHPIRVEPGLLFRLAQGRRDLISVLRVAPAARKGHLIGMVAQVRRALQQEHIDIGDAKAGEPFVLALTAGSARLLATAEQHEHRGIAHRLVDLLLPAPQPLLIAAGGR